MIEGRIHKLEKAAKSLRLKFRAVFVILLFLAIVNIGQLFSGQYNYIQKQLIDSTTEKSNTSDSKPKLITSGDYKTAINSFYNNTAISQIGYQLDLKANSISTKGTTNCFTPTPPPAKNGCGFEIRPYATSIPTQGVKLLNIIFKGKVDQNDKIILDIKNSETSEITSSLNTIEGRFKELSAKLPSNLKQNEQILVRLWPNSGSEITVEEIIFEYLDINKLQPIELKLTTEDVKKYLGKKMNIYLDIDKNGLFDKSVDLLWSCLEGFSGIKDISIRDNESIQLERDESCVKENVPSNWKNDSGSSALSPYHWLAVINIDEKTNKSFAFQVSKDNNTYNLNN